jgi:hypothetical protein
MNNNININISGSVGYILFKHNKLDLYVLVLSDVHDGVSYCNQDSIMIDKWLAMKDSNNVLLEESVRELLELKMLWPNAEHTSRLNKLYNSNEKITPIDIRPLLIPFSWEIVNDDEKISHVTLSEYLSIIDEFFYYKNKKFMKKYIIPELKKLETSIYANKHIVITHFYEIRELYFEFKKEYKRYMNTPIKELYIYKKDLLEKINNLISMIMEWYIILLIFNSNKNTIIHLGLAHSNRIVDLLDQVYDFSIIKQSGINYMEDIDINPKACVSMPERINNIFKKKYMIYNNEYIYRRRL